MTMAQTVADFLVDRLHAWGVRRIYGYPGDGINGILGALDRAQDRLKYVQTRHEELAAFMATAHSKFTGTVGVCLATSGPGAIHLLNGLYDAKKDHMPVVAIVGQTRTVGIGSGYQQEIDLLSLLKDVASSYVQVVTNPAQLRHVVDQAMRIALANRVPTAIIIPADIQELSAQASPPREHGAVFSGIGYWAPQIIPTSDQLQRAAEVLNAGKRVAILIGSGCIGAEQEVTDVANRLNAVVAKALLGKTVLPDNIPWCTGTIGLLGTKPSWDAMMECDTFLMIGSSFPYAEFLPPEGNARGVQIDRKAENLSIRYPMEVPLHGDAVSTIRALLPLLHQKTDSSWREKISQGVEEWWKIVEARAKNTADPINPNLVLWELSEHAPANLVITADSGMSTFLYGRNVRAQRGMIGTLSGGLATMCPAVPYAIAAKLCFPERPAVAVVGDGAMQMLGNNALISIGEHWREWADPRLIICVLNNRDLNLVTWELRVMGGQRKFEQSQDVPDFNYARYGELCGLRGIRVDRAEDVASVWADALSADRPVVLDFVVDPNQSPIPPHIKPEMAINMMKSMLRGDENTFGIIKQSMKDMIQEYLPH